MTPHTTSMSAALSPWHLGTYRYDVYIECTLLHCCNGDGSEVHCEKQKASFCLSLRVCVPVVPVLLLWPLLYGKRSALKSQWHASYHSARVLGTKILRNTNGS